MNNILLYIGNLLKDNPNNKRLVILINNLMDSFKQISNDMRNDQYSSNNVGTSTSFGDQQLEIDIKIVGPYHYCIAKVNRGKRKRKPRTHKQSKKTAGAARG